MITPNSQLATCSNAQRLGVGDATAVGSWELSSVENAFQKPLLGVTLAEDAIGRAIVERHIPLVAIPWAI